MTLAWLFPLGALGLLALGAIVVLHMRHRMPGIVSFPQLAFWPRVPSESRESPRWRKPPISLLLLLQLLAALALALAFMRPAMPDVAGLISQRADAVQHVIVLDGSTSMLARTDDGRQRWDVAREEVATVLDSWQQGDGVTIVVASGNPTWKRAVDGATVDDLREWLADLPVPGGSPDQQTVWSLVDGSLLPDLAPNITLVTDGGTTMSEVDVVLVGEATASGGNVAIVDTAVVSDGGDRSIRATVLHDRPATETLPWVARAGDADIATGTITLASGESDTFAFGVPDGVEQVTVSMVVDDALPEDDAAVVSFTGDTLTGLSVVLVSDLPGAVQRVLEVLPGVQVEVYPSTTPGIREIAAGADLVVYDGSAPSPDDVPNAPMLLVQPSDLENAWQIGGVAPNPEVGDIRLDDAIMRDVSLEGVLFGETPIYVLPPEAEVLAFGSDDVTTLPLIWRGTISDQPYVAFAIDPARSNFADRVSFPVLIAKTVDALVGETAGGRTIPGETMTFDVPGDVLAVEMVDPEGGRTVITLPGTDGGDQQVTLPVSAVPGQWTIGLLDASGFQVDSGAMTVNVGDRAEATLSQPDVVDLSSTGVGSQPGEPSPTESSALVELWPLLVLVGIAVISMEWWAWLARSVGFRRAPGGTRP
ncbi:hypothetical protein BH23CHL3_BH23CHL3_02720 [soil metagenome]